MRLRTRQTQIKVEFEGHVFTGKILTPTEVAKLQSMCAKSKRGKDTSNQTDYLFELFNHRVVAWEPNPTDEDGNEIVCNRKNKKLIWDYDNNFCGALLTQLNQAAAQKEDFAAKNSKPGASGTSSQKKKEASE